MDSTEIAKNRLSDFIKEMNAWEIECGRIEDENIDEAEQFELQKNMLEDIFARYCTDKKRINGRPNTISYGEEGSFDYDPKEEKIIDTNEEKDKILITTQREVPMKEQFVYTLIRNGGVWLLDSKKRYSTWKKKWEVVSL